MDGTPGGFGLSLVVETASDQRPASIITVNPVTGSNGGRVAQKTSLDRILSLQHKYSFHHVCIMIWECMYIGLVISVNINEIFKYY